jgi:predicted AAA+ superfamily ATPase
MQIARYQHKMIQEYLLQFPAVLVLGSRQTGKTTLCKTVSANWSIFDLESESDKQFISRDPEQFLQQHKEHKLMIDEAQMLPELFSALRVAIDRRRSEKGRYLLTGSSSPELLTHVSDSLAGRVGILELGTLKASERFGLPLSAFYEIISSSLNTQSLLSVDSNLTQSQMENAFFEGGFPELTTLERDDQKQRWLQSYISTYVERDLRRLYPRLNIVSYRLFISMLAQLQGKLVNMSDIARGLGVSQPTVREYLEIAHGTYVWRRINSYTQNSLRRVVKMPKGLYRDSGLANHLLYLSQLSLLRSSPLVGALWEAFIIEEILKGFAVSDIWTEQYFYRSSDGREVDLILQGSFGLLPIEIKYGSAISNEDLKPIKMFMDENNLPLGLVISNIDRPRLLSDGLVEIPARMI